MKGAVRAGSTPSREEALRTLANYVAPHLRAVQIANAPPDIVKWAHANYYIPETGLPIRLQPHQQVFARLFADISLPVSNYVYSTVKKSGKTAFAGVCARYTSEYSGNNAETYFIANDREQARDRAYESAKISIEKTPGFLGSKRELPGRWRIIEKRATHLPTGSYMQALAGDYESVSGSNPTATFWTELWSFHGERFTRLWDELTNVPTRERSFRFVETYAGFVDESLLLYDLYRRAVKNGDRLTKDDLAKHMPPGEDPWPFDDPPPFYINPGARTLAYWDEGPQAQRRMPWQVSERGRAYYQEQMATERVESYQRLHLNMWVSSAQAFINPAWWTACRSPKPALPKDWPIVVGVDGSVNSDCTAALGVCREPVVNAAGKLVPSDTDVRLVFARVWVPPRGGVIDLEDVEAYLRAICGHGATITPERREQYADQPSYNVVQITYDAYQLALMMQRLGSDWVAWCRPFSQAGEREIADKALYDSILNKTIHHNDEFDPEYMANAAAYVGAVTAKNQDRLRIVKKGPDAKVDPVVTLSMASAECRRLLLS